MKTDFIDECYTINNQILRGEGTIKFIWSHQNLRIALEIINCRRSFAFYKHNFTFEIIEIILMQSNSILYILLKLLIVSHLSNKF